MRYMAQTIDYPETPCWEYPSFINENPSKNYTPHDALFKKLIKDYFKQFIKAFLPQAYEILNFKTINFLSEEMIVNPFKDEIQFLDIVAKIQEKETKEEVILHIEPQSYRQHDFNERIFCYAASLYLQHRLPLVNIALFNFAKPSWSEDQFKVQRFANKTFEFNFKNIYLSTLHWKNFKNKPNPVTATLMCLMDHKDEDRIALKIAFYRMLVKAKINNEQGKFLLRFFDQYLPLTEEESEKVMEHIKQEPDTFDIDSLPIGIEEIAKKQGLEQGKKEGKKEGEQREKERIAISMLKDRMPIETIEKHVELSKEQIKQLKNNS